MSRIRQRMSVEAYRGGDYEPDEAAYREGDYEPVEAAYREGDDEPVEHYREVKTHEAYFSRYCDWPIGCRVAPRLMDSDENVEYVYRVPYEMMVQAALALWKRADVERPDLGAGRGFDIGLDLILQRIDSVPWNKVFYRTDPVVRLARRGRRFVGSFGDMPYNTCGRRDTIPLENVRFETSMMTPDAALDAALRAALSDDDSVVRVAILFDEQPRIGGNSRLVLAFTEPTEIQALPAGACVAMPLGDALPVPPGFLLAHEAARQSFAFSRTDS